MINAAAQAPRAERTASFLDALRNLRATPYRVGSAREAVETLHTIVDAAEARPVAVAGLPPAVRMLAESALRGVEHRFAEELKPDDALDFISKAQMGITWAEFGVVELGAVMEVSYDDATKLCSSLPPTNVMLLSSARLVPTLEDAMQEAGRLFSAEGRKPVISLISGPSKTADIEMRLLYGVHGPHTLHVMVLDWL